MTSAVGVVMGPPGPRGLEDPFPQLWASGRPSGSCSGRKALLSFLEEAAPGLLGAGV